MRILPGTPPTRAPQSLPPAAVAGTPGAAALRGALPELVGEAGRWGRGLLFGRDIQGKVYGLVGLGFGEARPASNRTKVQRMRPSA